LIRQEKIYKLGKGFYTSLAESSLTVFSFSPSYLGLQNAMSFHNLWEQETIPVVITSRNVRKGMRQILGGNVLIKKIDKKYMFGFEYYKYSLNDRDIYLPYSDVEKTFIDMIYFRQPLDKEAIKEFKRKISIKTLKSYLKAYPSAFRKRVLRI
jgi:predicted transcriptional regulator of viral defense system